MEWREDSGLAKEMLAMLDQDVRQVKTQTHPTELIYCLTKSWYRRRKPLASSDTETLLFLCGIGLEEVLLRPHENQQTKLELDGIHCTLDFTPEGRVGEVKSTRMGTKKFPGGAPEGWTRQMLSYMKAYGVLEGSFVIIHLMGSYSPPFPMLVAWRVTATQEEVDENWRWMLGRKEIYLGYLETDGAPPPFTHCEIWECGNCGYKMICEAMSAVCRVEPPSLDAPADDIYPPPS